MAAAKSTVRSIRKPAPAEDQPLLDFCVLRPEHPKLLDDEDLTYTTDDVLWGIIGLVDDMVGSPNRENPAAARMLSALRVLTGELQARMCHGTFDGHEAINRVILQELEDASPAEAATNPPV